MIYLSSDLHLNHANIIKYSNRPFGSVEDMNKDCLETINKTVRPEDELWFLGDFTFRCHNDLSKFIDVWNLIKCENITWILGNHDNLYWDTNSVNQRFAICHNRNPFMFVGPYKEIQIGKRNFILFHYPILEWNKKYHGSYHFYGHCHEKNFLMPGTRSCEVGYDSTGKWVLTLDEAIALADQNYESGKDI